MVIDMYGTAPSDFNTDVLIKELERRGFDLEAVVKFADLVRSEPNFDLTIRNRADNFFNEWVEFCSG